MIPQSFKSFGLGAALTVLLAGGASAQTAPGTEVSNTISVTFNSGAGTPTVTLPTVESHTAVFNVDRKIDVLVTAVAGSGVRPAVPGETVTWSYEVQNNGNGTQGFTLANTAEGENGGTLLSLTRVGTTAALEEGEYRVWVSPVDDISDAAATVYGTDGTLASDRDAGEGFFVIFEARVAINAIDGQNNVFQVVATVTDEGTATPVVEARNLGLTGVNRIFADAETTGAFAAAGATFAALDGNDGCDTQLLITAPVLTATKVVAVLAENIPGQAAFDCATGGTAVSGAVAAIPGAYVEYTITVTNSSVATPATNITVTDPIPDNTTYAGVSVGDFTSVVANGAGDEVTATLNSLATGDTATFRVRVLVD